MKCSHCGAQMPENVTRCPYCDAEVVVERTKEETGESNYCEYCGRKLMPDEICQCQKNVNNTQTQQISNIMCGKQYQFSSSSYMYLALLGRGKIYSSVVADEEKMSINVKPDKKNLIPVIYFSDITCINIKYQLSIYYLIMMLCSIAAMLGNPFLGLFAILFWWLGSNWKIIIFLRSGNRAEIYSGSKNAATTFVNDLKQATGV